tara:strand:- start:383 stop:622 length:240 start_codon:yes stop_codon:yes gene_type:complete
MKKIKRIIINMLNKILNILEEKNHIILDENQINFLKVICEENKDKEENELVLKKILLTFSNKFPHIISIKNIDSLLKEN